MGASIAGYRYKKNRVFRYLRQIFRFISETIQDRAIVAIERQ